MTCTVYICWRESSSFKETHWSDSLFNVSLSCSIWQDWWVFDLVWMMRVLWSDFFIVFTFTFYSLIDKTDGYLVWPCTKCSHRSDRETLIWFADRWPSLPQMDSSQCWWSLYLGGQQKTPASMLGVKQKFCRK